VTVDDVTITERGVALDAFPRQLELAYQSGFQVGFATPRRAYQREHESLSVTRVAAPKRSITARPGTCECRERELAYSPWPRETKWCHVSSVNDPSVAPHSKLAIAADGDQHASTAIEERLRSHGQQSPDGSEIAEAADGSRARGTIREGSMADDIHRPQRRPRGVLGVRTGPGPSSTSRGRFVTIRASGPGWPRKLMSVAGFALSDWAPATPRRA
jgi:hypothetical protein